MEPQMAFLKDLREKREVASNVRQQLLKWGIYLELNAL